MRDWDEVAVGFLALREGGAIGAAAVCSWARLLRPRSRVLDLGCGSGVPIARALLDAGHAVCGIDASPSMCAASRLRCPEAEVACEPVETSALLERRWDGVVAWGLIFLLEEARQRALIRRVGCALEPEGSFLFTAPAIACEWEDLTTGRRSISLGAAAYGAALAEAGLESGERFVDEGQNHYFVARRRSRP